MAIYFPEVTERGEIETLSFLAACRSLKYLYDALGTTLLIVKKDLLGNVEKLTKVYEDSQSKYRYINDLVLKEKEDPYLFAVDALLWLKRSLALTLYITKGFFIECRKDNPSESMNDIATYAYNKHLRKHHNWMVQNIFQVCIGYFPTRMEILNAGRDVFCEADERLTKEKILEVMENYFSKMEANLSVLNKLFVDWDLEALVEMNI